MSERLESWWSGFECCMLDAKNIRSCNKLLKFWIAGVTDEFSSETLILRKRLSTLHTKCIQFLRWLSLLVCTCHAGEMMIPCQVSTFSEFICSDFQFQGHIAQKTIKCVKKNKSSQKGLKIDDVALNGAFWTHKKSGVQISSKKWNPFVTDEFPYETLILPPFRIIGLN